MTMSASEVFVRRDGTETVTIREISTGKILLTDVLMDKMQSIVLKRSMFKLQEKSKHFALFGQIIP